MASRKAHLPKLSGKRTPRPCGVTSASWAYKHIRIAVSGPGVVSAVVMNPNMPFMQGLQVGYMHLVVQYLLVDQIRQARDSRGDRAIRGSVLSAENRFLVVSIRELLWIAFKGVSFVGLVGASPKEAKKPSRSDSVMPERLEILGAFSIGHLGEIPLNAFETGRHANGPIELVVRVGLHILAVFPPLRECGIELVVCRIVVHPSFRRI